MSNEKLDLKNYLKNLSSSNSTPGGGSTAGIAGAIAVSLTMMVMNILNSKDSLPDDFFKKNIENLIEMRKNFLKLAEKDSEIYKEFKKESDITSDGAQFKLKKAINIPLQVCNNAESLNEIIENLIPHVKSSLIGDLDAALRFNENAFRTSFYNIKVNLVNVKDEKFVFKINDFCEIESSKIAEQFEELLNITGEKIKG